MRHEDAVALIDPAIGPTTEPTRWADLGSGDGGFTRALAELLPPGSEIIAVDRDRSALKRLEAAVPGWGTDVHVRAVPGDLHDLGAVPGLDDPPMDGALLANALHFDADPGPILVDVAGRVRSGGRLVVVEYDGRRSNPWVPHILGRDRLRDAAERAGLGSPEVVGTRPSSYAGFLYCAWLPV